jgi:hypothetical protein
MHHQVNDATAPLAPAAEPPAWRLGVGVCPAYALIERSCALLMRYSYSWLVWCPRLDLCIWIIAFPVSLEISHPRVGETRVEVPPIDNPSSFWKLGADISAAGLPAYGCSRLGAPEPASKLGERIGALEQIERTRKPIGLFGPVPKRHRDGRHGSIALRNRRCLRRHDVLCRGSPDGTDDDGAEEPIHAPTASRTRRVTTWKSIAGELLALSRTS